ncbi:glycosyltransferase [Paenibacillus methanolicus]|uniref:Glycosyl transferase family 2 n=1 Tax=Paenibacillus methanolicus TaxID=582686 RepID=A0A5S5CJ77_9BACL|nr:glycosyltransferase family 2 protein [Paenibacillus methanolicus]TYP79800.1 glycosyl transferase family 2 [Paenibacillus methanolicus]
MNDRLREQLAQLGVSVVTCTNRAAYIDNLFRNFARQRHARKELILVVNDDRISLAPYVKIARELGNVRIYRQPGNRSLGFCLNYAVQQARYGYVAKFDDDDYYAPYYLSEGLLTFRDSGADVIGKRSHYMYLKGSRTLIHRFPQDEHRKVAMLPGATLIMKRKVALRVRFPNISVGEDDQFCLRCRRLGYVVYSGGKSNFTAVRRRNSSNHTWIISDKTLLKHHKRIPNVRRYKKFVQRRPKGVE